MAPKNLKVCKANTRDQVTGIKKTCDTEYAGEECPKYKTEHMLPFVTGYCNSKWCEGTKAKSYSGTPAPTCKFWLKCPCDCHDLVSMMFLQVEMPRVLVENPEYKPAKIAGMMTSEERARANAERAREERTARHAEAILTDGGTEIHSPSGRTRKGLLDEWMEKVCKVWLVDPSVECTPGWISEHINMFFEVTAPSVGAIDAVLKRWSECGFATMEKKPTRFTGFTPEGQRLGLDVMREKARLDSKRWKQPPALAGRK